jgi:hypothetical protein
MDILFYILFALSGPVLYVIGLLTVLRWFTHRGRGSAEIQIDRPTSAASVDNAAIAELRLLAGKQSPELSRELNKIIGRLEGGISVARFEPGHSPDESSDATPASSSTVASGWQGMAPADAPTPSPSWSSINVSDVARSLDNINVILYLGAFLVVVSAGIFVGYNFETLSGVFKTVFLALFATIFYAVGLMLYLRTVKLRPAGVTFTGIGLVLLPLIGLAAYNFTSLHDFGSATWFATSIITLAAYIVTLSVTRQTYIAYLMAFTALSTFESSISLFNLPVYWFGWGMAIVSILLLVLGRTKLLWEDTSDAIMLSANIFVPISLLLSFFAVGDNGLSQVGVTIGLAGVFYAAMADRFSSKPDGETYWALALMSLPAALSVGLWDSLSRTGIAAIMLGVCAVYFVGEHLLTKRLSQRWCQLLGIITGLLPLAGIIVLYDHPGAIAAILAAAVLINGELALRQRQSGLALLAVLSLLALPFVFVRLYLDPAWPWSAVAAALMVEVPLLVWWARRLRGWPDSGEVVGVAGYLLALVLALCAAALSSQTALLVVGLGVAGALYVLSLTEHRNEYIYGAAASLYLALAQLAGINSWNFASVSLILLLSGGAMYLLGAVEENPERALPLRYSGLFGPFIGAFAGIGQESHHLEPVLALAVGGGLLFTEAKRQVQPLLQEVAGGILVLSFNWLLNVLDVTQTQLYTVPWAAYAAYLAYRRRDLGHEIYDGFVVVALGILTVPLAAQALGENGQGYGLLLIFEAIALVFIGMGLSFRLVTMWGVVTLVLEVLYQLRDFFYALPKYLISAGLGLALLAVAIVMLQRRGNDE